MKCEECYVSEASLKQNNEKKVRFRSQRESSENRHKDEVHKISEVGEESEVL